ncbi:hypothetical protein GX51_06489 [Blastomyces parvus]|uniref:Knr4/Smi1-like domain-containing protein n=1 Tax=Blastomyces parvus TaxID=2060905 RepID=A0A2B7WQU6_9EURO|nr:hypothetical protein GX51_06489 [Blastomyces parvus]
MASSFGSAFRSFWHTMTSNDRHASHDSPYRTGQHVPLSQNRNAPLTSVATSAVESRPDLTSFEEDAAKRSSSPGWSGSQGGVTSPVRPYSPGMRSLSSQQRRSNELNSPDGVAPTEIQMQSFHDGAPPPPPVAHSWRKIDRWAENNYEELYDQLGEGCTQNDVNELEHELDCTLPIEVRESLQLHDGQERGGRPTGIIFGCMLLDCEEIVQEWRNWRTVNEEFLSTSSFSPPQQPIKAFGGSSAPSSSSAPPPPPAQTGANPLWRQELLDKQDSQPPKAIQKAYAHPSWIPLARDWGGNNIAVDLAPGPAGKWGQVILFGRDYDCKYVVARSWAAFLAIVADDLCSPKTFVDDESGELKLKQFKQPGVEPPYLEILRWRTDQKYGRRPPRRKTPNGLGVNTGVNGNRDSPYGSPTTAASGDERGRSPHRFPPRGPNASPKTAFGVSSPLARVTEEATSPASPDGSNKIDAPSSVNSDAAKKPDSLVDAASSTMTTTTAATSVTDTSKSDLNPTESAEIDPSPGPSKEKEKEKNKRRSNLTSPRSSTGLDADALEGMKSIAI